MNPSLAAFLASLLAACALTPIARAIAVRTGVVDLPSSPRKIHQGAIPRLGGVAVCVAFFVGIGVLLLDPAARATLAREPPMALGFLLSAVAITALGVWDDARGLAYKQKFAGEIAVALVLYGFGYRIPVLSLPWIGDVHLGILSFPVTVLWLVGVTNAVNLIDGLDGLAAGVSLFALGTVYVNALFDGNLAVLPLAAALGGATLGFLLYNVHPARIFLGDGGALLLGSSLGALSIRTYSKAGAGLALLAPVVMLGLPITDTLVSMIRRYLRGRSPFEADREHLHHRLLALGLSQRGAVAALYGIAIAFSALTLSLRGHSPLRSAIGLLLCLLLVLALLRALNYREVLHLVDGLRSVRLARERARERLLWLKERRRGWRGVASAEELWRLLCDTPAPLGLATLELHLPQARTFRAGPTVKPDDSAWARFALERGGTSYGELVVAVTTGHRTVLLDDERLVYEYLADFIGDALEDIARRGHEAQGVLGEGEPVPARQTLLGVGAVKDPTPTPSAA